MRSVLALAALAAAGLTAPAQDTAGPAGVKPGNYFLWYSGTPAVQQRLAIVKVDDKEVTSVAAGQMEPEFGKVAAKAGRVQFPVTLGSNNLTFEGAVDPADPKRVLGTLGDDDRVFRAGLTPTDKTKLDQADALFRVPQPKAMADATKAEAAAFAAVRKARGEKDADEKKKLQAEADKLRKDADAANAAAYRAILKDEADSPFAVQAAEGLLARAKLFNVSAEDAAKYVAAIEADAKKYGPRFEAVSATRLATTLGQTDFAPLALAAAKKAAAVPGLSAKNKASALALLADAQAKAGLTKEAAATKAEVAKLEGEIDAEYKKTVPPFKPEPYAGRKDAAANKVAVMELFTGAQCPPCVAADVAFDALVTRYPHKDVVLLQYHLHIPGPDPLTNPDAVARFGYYGKLFEGDFGGTPSTAFNGKPAAGGGGGMGNSKGKHAEYVKLIDKQLEQKTDAKLAGEAKLDGDTMTVAVEASVKDAKASVKLRLVLAEDEVKYVGGNGLRFHHHVVRGLLGTVDGVPVKDLKDGKHTAKASVKDVKAELTKYLDKFAADERPFPNPNRPLDLAHLKVFALVQDDDTGEILQAAELPLAGK